MEDLQINHKLTNWDEIENDDWKSLLLGNGFSINLWSRFGYARLYEIAQLSESDERLSSESMALFSHLESSNFEDVLRVLYHAELVDQQLGNLQKSQIIGLYENIKRSLASAINYSHVKPDFHSISSVNSSLSRFRNIFTTNYDLIPYWSIMNGDVSQFKDLFWGADNTFDISDTFVAADKCTIHYLHGAIHLVEKMDGKTKKLRANGIEKLADLFDLDHPDQFPLFIAEGSSSWKLSRIKRNDYLRFSYEKLCKSEGNLIVIGHSLHKNYDQHIIDAIQESKFGHIAISVWPHQEQAAIIEFKARLYRELSEKTLHFFDSETHPLSKPELRVYE